MRGRIIGTGKSVPEKVLTNADLERMVDTSDGWITTRSGIKERRIAAADESLSTFAIPAATNALEMAELNGEDIDLVVCGTVTSDMPFPATANLIQNHIGASKAAAFDLSAGCSGFVYSLSVAEQFIESGAAKNVLVVGGEVLSKVTDWTDRGTCVLFGDGAGAVVLQATEGDRGVLACGLRSDGSMEDLIYMPGGGSKHPPSKELYESKLPFIKMRGNETFKIAVRSLTEISAQLLEQCEIEQSEVRWFVPHQANRRIIDAVGQRLHIPEGHTYVNIQNYGNTSSASIPIALDELNRDGKIEPGDIVLMSAFGAGLTWGGSVVRW